MTSFSLGESDNSDEGGDSMYSMVTSITSALSSASEEPTSMEGPKLSDGLIKFVLKPIRKLSSEDNQV